MAGAAEDDDLVATTPSLLSLPTAPPAAGA